MHAKVRAAPVLQGFVHRCFQIMYTHRFEQVVDRLRLDRSNGAFKGRVTSEDDDGQVRPVLPGGLHHLHPSHARHVHVDNQHIERRSLKPGQSDWT